MRWGFSLVAAIGLVAGATGRAEAGMYLLTFTNAGGTVSGSALLDATDNGGGSFTAVSGTGTVSVFGTPDTISLFPNPSAPGGATSPSGAFSYDNQLFPGSDPVVNFSGLLFTRSGGIEVNIFATGSGAYEYWEFDPSAGYTVTEPAMTVTLRAYPGSYACFCGVFRGYLNAA